MNPPDLLDDPTQPSDGERPPSSAAPGLAARLRGHALAVARRVWFWPTVATLLVGLFGIWHPQLWRDELRSWSAATRSLPDLFHLLGNTDAAVALYYLVLHFWVVVFGDSTVSLRIPSTLAMAAAAGVLTVIGQRLFSRRVAIIAGFLFALIPSISRFGEEVRPYAITMLVACIATLLLLRALDRPSWGRLVGYAVMLAVLFLTQIVAAPILLAHLIAVLLWYPRNRGVWLRLGGAMVVGVVLASPIVLLSHAQYDHQVGALPDATLHELFLLPPRLFASAMISGAVIVLGILAFSRPSKVTWFLAAWAILPILAVWGISNLGESFWMTRYMLFTLPAFCILAAATLATLDRRFVVVVVVLIAALGAQDQKAMRKSDAHEQWVYPNPANGLIDYVSAAQIIRQYQRPGDGMAIAARADVWLIDLGLAYHLQGEPQPTDTFVDTTALDRGDFWPIECDTMASCAADLGDTPRIWVLSIGPISNAFTDDPMDMMEPDKKALLEANYTVDQVWHPLGLNVELLVRR